MEGDRVIKIPVVPYKVDLRKTYHQGKNSRVMTLPETFRIAVEAAGGVVRTYSTPDGILLARAVPGIDEAHELTEAVEVLLAAAATALANGRTKLPEADRRLAMGELAKAFEHIEAALKKWEEAGE